MSPLDSDTDEYIELLCIVLILDWYWIDIEWGYYWIVFTHESKW